MINIYQIAYWVLSSRGVKGHNENDYFYGYYMSIETVILAMSSIFSFILHFIMTCIFYDTWMSFAREFSRSDYLNVKLKRAKCFAIVVSISILLGKFFMLISSSLLKYFDIF